jgi:hypothetical protein
MKQLVTGRVDTDDAAFEQKLLVKLQGDHNKLKALQG